MSSLRTAGLSVIIAVVGACTFPRPSDVTETDARPPTDAQDAGPDFAIGER
jgi:hypothetical protein